jgi:hypothetical protein
MKRCSKCGLTKPFDEFYLSAVGKPAGAMCKACRRQRQAVRLADRTQREAPGTTRPCAKCGGPAVVTANGLPRYVCRACRTLAFREWRVQNPEACRAGKREYFSQPVVREQNRERWRAYRAHNREKVRARKLLEDAIRHGRLTRQPCERCGTPNAEGHHEDYSRPFEVRWLCKSCHTLLHFPLTLPTLLPQKEGSRDRGTL